MMTLAGIQITLDGEVRQVATNLTLAQLVDSLGHDPRAVGTALNGIFVSRSLRDSHVLEYGDHVLLFQPITGG